MFHKFQKYFTNFWKLNQHMGDVSMTSSLLYLPEPVESLRSAGGCVRHEHECIQNSRDMHAAGHRLRATVQGSWLLMV
jgi:hypothetical protein